MFLSMRYLKTVFVFFWLCELAPAFHFAHLNRVVTVRSVHRRIEPVSAVESISEASGNSTSPTLVSDDSGQVVDVDSYLSSLSGKAPSTQWPPVPENYDFRRSLYLALKPLDKGDFRWEMLVPWLAPERMLTTADKGIVFVSFVALALAAQELASPEASIGGHLSYIANFFSYAIGNPVGFRVIAIVGSLLEIVGDIVETSATNTDGIPVIYNLLFIPINGYYVMRWLLNQESLVLNEEEEALYILCFVALGFTRGQFTRLLSSAVFETVPKEDEGGQPRTLCRQGDPMFDIFVSISGEIDLVVSGVVASAIPPYQLIGESALLENLQSEGGRYHLPARSTIVAEPGSSFVSWPQKALYDLQTSDPEIAFTFQLMIARTLSTKLLLARQSQQRAVEALDASRREQEESRLSLAIAREWKKKKKIKAEEANEEKEQEESREAQDKDIEQVRRTLLGH